MPMAASIAHVPYIFVVEMNYKSKKIIGVGLVLNKIVNDRRYNIYKDNARNTFTYKSNARMAKVDFSREEMETIEELEILLFTGYGHFVRGIGFSKLPDKITHIKGLVGNLKNPRVVKTYVNNYVRFFTKAFSRHYGERLAI